MTNQELLLFLSVLPSIVLGYIIYKKDKVEKEPTGLLIKLLFGGLGAAALTIFITIIVEGFFPSLSKEENFNVFQTFLQILLEVALVEEFSKWIFLKKITWKNKEFNYLYDAIVYGVFVSIGFATIENILYVLDGGLIVAIIRAILSVPGHIFYGVFMGYYYGISKLGEINQNEHIRKKNMILSLLIPTILHFTFDFCLSYPNAYILIFYLVFVILLYVKAFKKVNQLSKITKSLTPIPIKTTYCTNCGHEVKGTYCHNCGNKIENR